MLNGLRTGIRIPNFSTRLFGKGAEKIRLATPDVLHEDIFSNYPGSVTADMNSMLCAVPNTTEIWDAICSLSTDSAPGIDGYTGHFFRGCWQIIQQDMIDMIHGFLLGDYRHYHITSTSLTLIPKVNKPRVIADYRPISLSSFASKVISKIIASRLARCLPSLINEHQFGFVKGRNIHESIALAQEMVADLDRRSEAGNIIFKYDMSKAYDRVEWRFLLRSLRAMGFSEGFQDLIYRSICNIRYPVCVNGFYSAEFRSSSGVRQGDPLSPLLFVVAQQILSYNLNKLQEKGRVWSYRLGRNVSPISHIFYADDMLVFTNGRIRSIRCLHQLMIHYEESSGQKVNFEKSAFYPSKFIPNCRLARIQQISGCLKRNFPFKYLGAPIYRGRCQNAFFEDIMDKFARRLEGWHSKFLSFGG